VEALITSPGLERVAAMLTARRDELAAATLSAIQAECPAYAAIDDPVILADVQQHVAENHDALCASIVSGRPVASGDLAFIRPHAALRARRGLPVADFLHAFRVGHRVIWEAIAELAEMREWRGAVGTILSYNVPVVGSWPQDYHDHVEANLAQVGVAANTAADQEAMQLLRNEFSNQTTWASEVVGTRQSMNATNTVRPDTLQNDTALAKITNCSRFLNSMFISGSFSDDASCH